MTTNLDAHIGYGVTLGAFASVVLWKVIGFPLDKAVAIGLAACVIGSLTELWERMG